MGVGCGGRRVDSGGVSGHGQTIYLEKVCTGVLGKILMLLLNKTCLQKLATDSVSERRCCVPSASAQFFTSNSASQTGGTLQEPCSSTHSTGLYSLCNSTEQPFAAMSPSRDILLGVLNSRVVIMNTSSISLLSP